MVKIIAEFDSIAEFDEFRANGEAETDKPKRGRRSPKADSAASAPEPIQPPTGAPGIGFPAFAPPQAAGPSPEVMAVVQRIIVRLDAAINTGQPVEGVLNWFREQCGAEAAAATLDQIKQYFLPRLSMERLTDIAKQMNA